MGVPHAGGELHTHIPGSWVLPLERKNKTGLTESKLIQHEEALKKKKKNKRIIFDTRKIDKSSRKMSLTRPKIHHNAAGRRQQIKLPNGCDVFIPPGTGKAAEFRDDSRDLSQDS